MEGRLEAVLLCLRYVLYVDTAVAIGAWFVPSWCAQNSAAEVQIQNKKEKRAKKRKRKTVLVEL